MHVRKAQILNSSISNQSYLVLLRSMHSSTVFIKHSFGVRYFLITGFFLPRKLTAIPYSNLLILLSVNQTRVLRITCSVQYMVTGMNSKWALKGLKTRTDSRHYLDDEHIKANWVIQQNVMIVINNSYLVHTSDFRTRVMCI